jgi:hypothetical protein
LVHGLALLTLIGILQREFLEEFEAVRLERNEKNRLRAKSKRAAAAAADADDCEGEEGGNEDENITESPMAPPRPAPRRLEKRTLDDVTNLPRAKRQALESVAAVAESFGPRYKPRRRNVENI